MPERILVTDVEERALLAVCRGLAQAGYRVSGVAGTRPAAGHWSKSVERKYTLPNPRLDAEGFVAGLAAIAAEGDHAVLIPGVDAAVLAVSEHRALFEPYLKIGLPPHDVVVRSFDKLALFEAADVAGLGPPPTTICASEDTALEVASNYGYPVVVKPARSFSRDRARMLTSAFARDEGELRVLLPSFGVPLTIQRHETGSVVSCGGVAAQGKPIGLCVARYERTWPPKGGSASSSRTIASPPGLEDRLERLLGELRWEGLFELELIETEGRLASIDFNPRPYGSLTLAVESGANLPALWCDWLLGRAPAPARGRVGVCYRWEEAELLNLFAALRRGSFRTAAALLRPEHGTAHAFLRAGDPAPLAARALALARARLGRRRI
jgi:predicted ATP-grasp superfamily ATP-dependent carboligase